MFMLLLTIHMASAMVWLGGAIYERLFIVSQFYKVKGTQLEMAYAKIVLATEKLFILATVGILGSGILMTVVAGYGFFEWSWLGLKQWIAVLMLLFFVLYIAPRMKTFRRSFEEAAAQEGVLSEEGRRSFVKFYTALDISHIGLVVNILLAIWKPFY